MAAFVVDGVGLLAEAGSCTVDAAQGAPKGEGGRSGIDAVAHGIGR
ncbi:hypothetical protein AB0O75_13680 [Streptomyces sp. NPDC088921]